MRVTLEGLDGRSRPGLPAASARRHRRPVRIGNDSDEYYYGSNDDDDDDYIPPRPRKSWDQWKWMIIMQGVAIIGLAIGLILVAATHSDHTHSLTPARRQRGAPMQIIELLPSDGVQNYAPPMRYTFTVTSEFARYPSHGNGIPGLGEMVPRTAECCCKYIVSGRRVKQRTVCLSTTDPKSPEMEFYIRGTLGSSGSHLILTVGAKLLGAKCTLSWGEE